jgi:hypothetical protein
MASGMRRFANLLLTLSGTLAVWFCALLCYRWITEEDGVVAGDIGVLKILFAVAVGVFLVAAIAIALDQPGRAFPNARREDWPYYAAATVCMMLVLAAITLPSYLAPAPGTPIWPMFVVPLLAWPAMHIASIPAVRRRKRKQAGLCSECGYDLRGSPERCPECGAKPAAK